VAGPKLQTLVVLSAASDASGRLLILLDEVLQRCPGLKVLSLQFIGGLSRSFEHASFRHAGIEVLVLHGSAASSVADLAVLGFTALRALELYQLDVVRLALPDTLEQLRVEQCHRASFAGFPPSLKTVELDEWSEWTRKAHSVTDVSLELLRHLSMFPNAKTLTLSRQPNKLLVDELAARKIKCRVGKRSSRAPTLASWFNTLKLKI
jgi:hypothetical protein